MSYYFLFKHLQFCQLFCTPPPLWSRSSVIFWWPPPLPPGIFCDLFGEENRVIFEPSLNPMFCFGPNRHLLFGSRAMLNNYLGSFKYYVIQHSSPTDPPWIIQYKSRNIKIQKLRSFPSAVGKISLFAPIYPIYILYIAHWLLYHTKSSFGLCPNIIFWPIPKCDIWPTVLPPLPTPMTEHLILEVLLSKLSLIVIALWERLRQNILIIQCLVFCILS